MSIIWGIILYFSASKHSSHVKAGEELNLKFNLNQNILSLINCAQHVETNCNEESPTKTRSISNDSTTAAGVLNHTDSEKENIPVVFYLERSEISKLNNLQCNRVFCQALEKVIQSQKKCKNFVSVLDYSYGLSPLILQQKQHGCLSGSVVLREELRALFEHLCNVNNLPVENYEVLEPSALRECTKPHDVIVCDLLEVCGVLRQQILEDLAMLRYI